MASTIKATNIGTPDGTGNITVDRPLAGDGNALVGISPRNFIIDGDFTQWPEGATQASLANGQYGPAMWRWWGAGAQAVSDVQRSTDVPTVAQSGHQSAYSFQIDCTTAEDAVAASEWAHVDYHVTGNDFAHLHQQEVTLNFWHKHTKTGTFCVAFRNSAQNRSYIAEYTQTTTNTWEEATITLTLDTGGTWLFTEADIGLTIFFTLYTGSTYQASANSWQAGDYAGTSNQVNGLDSTSNNFMIAQVGLYLGGSAPTFTSPPIATVKDQVEYYVQRYDLTDNSAQWLCVGVCGVSASQSLLTWRRQLRVVPTVTSTAAATFEGGDIAAAADLNAITFNDVGRSTMRIQGNQAGSTWTNHSGFYITRDGTDTAWVMLDARH